MDEQVGHKLEITKRFPESRRSALTGRDLKVCVDGHEMKWLESLDLHIRLLDVNTATISFTVGEVEVDANVIAELEAIAERRELSAST